MKGTARARRIAILAHVGNENLGDEAIVTALVQNFRRRCPTADIYGITRHPADTRQRHGIRAYAIRAESADGPAPSLATPPEHGLGTVHPRFTRDIKRVLDRVPGALPALRAVRRGIEVVVGALAEVRHVVASYRLLRGTDLVIIGGSAQLMDNWGGPWSFPFTLFKWSLLAKLRGARVAFVSVGVGPLTTRIGKALIRRSLTWADYRAYREDSSRDLVRSLRVAGADTVVPDVVFSMDLPARGPEPQRRAPVVGINPMPLFDGTYWPQDDRPAYERYLETMARFADWLAALGYEVVFFPTQLRVDPGTICAVRARMERAPSGGGAAEQPIRSLEDLLTALRRMDMVVATRYHGTLFPLLLGKPVLSVAYQPKTRDLMRMVGQEQYAIDFGSLTQAALQERFLALVHEREAFMRVVAQRVRRAQEALERQYDCLLALSNAPVRVEEPFPMRLAARHRVSPAHSQPPSARC